MSRKRRLDQLEADLQEAVKQENYEEAARLRDLIAQTRAALEVS
jgi:protein-arginine kinase activator protein McsA